MKREVDELRAARHVLDVVRDVRELKPLLVEHVAHDALDLSDEAWIDEGIEPDDRVRVFQLLVDLRHFELLRPDVIDDLDALALLHVVGQDLADRAIRERVVLDVDEEVIEEVRAPQPMEIFLDRFFGLVRIRNPYAFRRAALLQLDVIQVGLRLDERLITLRLEARCNEEHDRA